jgi:hypothetical protein
MFSVQFLWVTKIQYTNTCTLNTVTRLVTIRKLSTTQIQVYIVWLQSGAFVWHRESSSVKCWWQNRHMPTKYSILVQASKIFVNYLCRLWVKPIHQLELFWKYSQQKGKSGEQNVKGWRLNLEDALVVWIGNWMREMEQKLMKLLRNKWKYSDSRCLWQICIRKKWYFAKKN